MIFYDININSYYIMLSVWVLKKKFDWKDYMFLELYCEGMEIFMLNYFQVINILKLGII